MLKIIRLFDPLNHTAILCWGFVLPSLISVLNKPNSSNGLPSLVSTLVSNAVNHRDIWSDNTQNQEHDDALAIPLDRQDKQDTFILSTETSRIHVAHAPIP